jgi:ABC-2 type transport system ATP-binding protein
MRMLVMLVPGAPDPVAPGFVTSITRVGHNQATLVAEQDVGKAIEWAQGLIASGQAEEYALGATSLEDVYIRLTGEVSAIGHDR